MLAGAFCFSASIGFHVVLSLSVRAAAPCFAWPRSSTPAHGRVCRGDFPEHGQAQPARKAIKQTRLHHSHKSARRSFQSGRVCDNLGFQGGPGSLVARHAGAAQGAWPHGGAARWRAARRIGHSDVVRTVCSLMFSDAWVLRSGCGEPCQYTNKPHVWP